MLVRELTEIPLSQRNDESGLAFRQAVDVRMGALDRGHVLLERLIRNQKLDGLQALEQWRKLRASWLLAPFPNQTREGKLGLGHRQLAPAEEAENRLAITVAPLIVKLPFKPPGPETKPWAIRSPEMLATAVYGELLECVFDRVDRSYRTPNDLSLYLRTYVDLIPDDYFVARPLDFYPQTNLTSRFAADSFESARVVGDDAITPADWLAFLNQLKQSGHRGAAMTGQITLGQAIIHDLFAAKAAGKSPSTAEAETFLREFTAQIDQWRLLPKVDGSGPRQFADPVPLVLNLQAIVDDQGKKHPSNQPSEASWETVKFGRVTFEPLVVRGNGSGSLEVPFVCELVRATDKLDIYYNCSAIWYMNQPGFFELVAHAKNDAIDSARWDGKHLWVGARGKGILIFDTNGKVVSRIGPDQGLPACDHRILLHVVDTDRICAVGSFGEHGRAWCAMVEPAGDGYRAEVFFQATEVPSDQQGPDSPELVFRPSQIQECDFGEGEHRVLVVERGNLNTSFNYQHLLAVNLDTRAVAFAPESAKQMKFVNGQMPGRPWDADLKWRRVLLDPRLAEESFYHQGHVYAFRSNWRRFDPLGTGVEELVPENTIDNGSQYKLYRAGVTAHYGLTMWGTEYEGRPGFYRLTIDEPPAAESQK